MKIWHGYGSEHSANLVMIGHFQDIGNAKHAEEAIEKMRQQVEKDDQLEPNGREELKQRYTDGMMTLIQELGVYDIGPTELEQLLYEYRLSREESKLIITTDESDISALIKLMIRKGARVEVYSAHDHPGTGHGR